MFLLKKNSSMFLTMSQNCQNNLMMFNKIGFFFIHELTKLFDENYQKSEIN